MTDPMAVDIASVNAFHDTITGSLPAGGDMSSLDASMRPIDALSTADLDWLKPYVQPMQQVLDTMAGKPSVIQSYADSWQHARDSAHQVAQQYGRSVQTQISTWQGSAGDAYRGRAAVVGSALDMTATMCATMSTITSGMGFAAADARKQVNDLVTQLVQQLVSTIGPTAAIQGPTPDLVAQATQLVNSYQTPVSNVLSQFRQQIADIQSKLGSGGTTGLAPMADASADDDSPQLVPVVDLDHAAHQEYLDALHGGPKSPMRRFYEHGHFNVPAFVPPGFFRPNAVPPPSAPIGAPKASAPSGITAPSAGKAPATPKARFPNSPPSSAPPSEDLSTATKVWNWLQGSWAKQKGKDETAFVREQNLEVYRGKTYKKDFEEQVGPPPSDGREYPVHHNLMVSKGKDFEKLGIDTSNPIYGSYVPKDKHNSELHQKTGKIWDDFIANNPNATPSRYWTRPVK